MKDLLIATATRFSRIGLFAAVASGFLASSASALIFNFVPTPATSATAIAGFAAAGNRWSSLFSDNITVNIAIDFSQLGAGILGTTNPTMATTTYINMKLALALDQTSTADTAAVAHLQAGSAFGQLLNYTQNNPNGAGSATPYLDNDGDANNQTIWLTTANAKALGIWGANNPASDASISFSTAFTWDFDPTNGITAGAIDFVGVATHEIGHALGFMSGVDILDGNSSGPFFRDDQFTFVAPLDLFRYSSASAALGVTDWTADARNKYFSIDGGTTNLGNFSTGTVHGDGRQASHWKDSLGLGIMDPTFAPGELGIVTNLDAQFFDVIGYNRVTLGEVPEPSTYGLAAIGMLAGVTLWRRKSRVS